MGSRCRFLLAAGLACLAALLPAADRQPLVVWGISAGPDSKGQDAVIREFSKRNPDLAVKLLSMGAGRMDPQKLMTSIVGNVAPDVIYQDRFTIADWAARGAFAPLDPFLARDANDPSAPRKEKFYAAPWAEASFENKVYAIPTGADNRVLYWNKAIFRENAAALRKAGLDPERAPRTWSELLRYSQVLTVKNPDGSLKRAGYLPNFGNAWLYLYAFQNDAQFISKDGRTCTLYSKPAEEALQYMVDGYDIVGGYESAKKFESGFLGKENDAFITGKVAMKVDGDWILSGLAVYGPKLDFATAPPPVPDDRFDKKGRFANEEETYVTWVGGFSMAIPKGARNPDGAWRYMKFAASTEALLIEARAQREWERLRGRTYIPRQIAQREANEIIAREFSPGEPKFRDAVAQHVAMAPHGKIRPATFVGQLLWSEHVKALEAACYKKASPATALKTGQAAVQRDLDAFYGKAKYPVVDLAVPGRIGAGIGGALLLLGGAWVSTRRQGRIGKTETRWAYLFIAPWLIGFVVLTAGPMVASLFLSFTQYDVLNEARWVGLKNYGEAFGSDWGTVSKAIGNTAYMAFVGVPLGLMTGLAIAMLLNTASRGIRLYRTLFYLPAVVPLTAASVLWTLVLNPDAGRGLINAYWNSTITPWLGVTPPGWLQSADWSKPALIMMGVWGAGSGMILWLAGLKGVPDTLYEASELDGATPTRQFLSITFPMLSPIIFFNAVMGIIGTAQEFDRMYIMKPSGDGPVGPDDSMLTPVYHLFKNGFGFFKMGYASSLAWIIFLIILALTATQFLLQKRWVYYEADK